MHKQGIFLQVMICLSNRSQGAITISKFHHAGKGKPMVKRIVILWYIWMGPNMWGVTFTKVFLLSKNAFYPVKTMPNGFSKSYAKIYVPYCLQIASDVTAVSPSFVKRVSLEHMVLYDMILNFILFLYSFWLFVICHSIHVCPFHQRK